MKFLPLPREKRRLLDPLGRTALTCLLTAGSFGGLCAPLPLALTAAAGPGLPPPSEPGAAGRTGRRSCLLSAGTSGPSGPGGQAAAVSPGAEAEISWTSPPFPPL